MRHASRIVLLATLCALVGCGDEAHREYMAALRADEDGSTRAEQLAHFDRAIELAPERGQYWSSRAVFHIDMRQFDRALADLDRALEIDDRPYQRFLRGLVLCQSGRHAASIAEFDAAIAAQPDNAQFYRGRSLARSALGDHAAALDDAERLVAMQPHVGTAYHARGVAHAGLGDHAAALADFDVAVLKRPELIYTLDSRAATLDALGETERADADRRAAAEARRLGAVAAEIDPFRY